MRVARKWRYVAAAALALGGVGIAAAQTEAPPGPGDVLGSQDVTLSPDQMRQEVAGYIPFIEQGRGTVAREAEEARAARDVVKVLCLNDKLTQLDVALRSARERHTSFTSALERGDLDRVRHEFTVLQVLRDRARDLVAEAEQCIGEETGFVGDSVVTVVVDPGLPDDPADYPIDPLISIPPTVSSPTQ